MADPNAALNLFLLLEKINLFLQAANIFIWLVLPTQFSGEIRKIWQIEITNAKMMRQSECIRQLVDGEALSIDQRIYLTLWQLAIGVDTNIFRVQSSSGRKAAPSDFSNFTHQNTKLSNIKKSLLSQRLCIITWIGIFKF
ncbi:MAG: hypothetical protein ONB27_00855 [candidate division KSB1 bacterium]|nr:hypothetical protein [candidate division KSB1 bacterium]